MADAEGYAAVQKAKIDNEVMLVRLEGEEQVAQYIYAREARKMNNVQQIVDKAKEQFAEGEQVSSEPINQDWKNRFFSIAEDISDEEMQKLWAQILAGEIKHPKSFSLRTLDVLRNISKEEAELLGKANQFYLASSYICTESFALDLFQNLQLSDAGLINNEALLRQWTVNKHSKQSVHYRDDVYLNLYNDTNRDITIKINVKQLTIAGQELLKLCDAPETDSFLSQLASKIKKNDIRLTKQYIPVINGEPNPDIEIAL